MGLFDDWLTDEIVWDDIADEDSLRRLITLTTHCPYCLEPTVSVYEPDDEDTVKNEQADNEVTL
jgi:hypothetical protein